MKHLLYFIIAALVVYLSGGLLMADFSWVLHIGFLGWIGAIFIFLWLFLQIEKEYGGWNIEEEEVDSWNEEDESDDQYISKMYVVKQKCTTANIVIYAVISFFYSQKFFC